MTVFEDYKSLALYIHNSSYWQQPVKADDLPIVYDDKAIIMPTEAVSYNITVEPWYDKWLRDRQKMFTITRFYYIKVVSHIFYHYCGKENSLFYWGLCYIEVSIRYIKVLLYFGRNDDIIWKGSPVEWFTLPDNGNNLEFLVLCNNY